MRRAALSLGLAAAAAVTAIASTSSDPLPARQAAPPAPPETVAPPSTAAATTTTPATTAPATGASFTVANLDLRAVRVAPVLSDGARSEITGALDRYLNRAVVDPLRTGRVTADLASVFSGPALERVNAPGGDRAALVDDVLPPLAEVNVGTASADLTALLGPDGVAALSAGIHIVVTGRLPAGTVTVERTGELQLSRDGDTWKVSGYDVAVTRRTP